uniref:Uncharacterized protein n=1 Tax=Trichobilharzia regenti TaxID=157069 RepID=A0AA85ISL9_TRIRE|nr:unnamed protein product [Trichobilharzia regenti]
MLMTDTFSAAHDNLIKNNGTPGLWFAHTADYCETPPRPRVRLDAVEIANRNKKHLTTAEISGFASSRTDCGGGNGEDPNDETSSDQKRQLRLRTPEALSIAEKSKSQSDKWYDFADNLNYKPIIKPRRIGAGEHGKAILENMTQECDWFKHKSFDGTNTEINPDRRKSSISSSYSRRNEVNNWFAHPQPKARETLDENTTSLPTRLRVHREGIEYSLKNRGLDDLLTMKMSPAEMQHTIPYGCPTEEAQNNAIWSKTGTSMALCLGKQPSNQMSQVLDNIDSSVIRPRSAAVRGSDAEKWRQLGRDGYMGSSMFLGTKQDPSSTVAHRVRPDGESIQEKSLSGYQMMNCLNMCKDNKQNENTVDDKDNSAYAGFRLRTIEALEAMKRNQGQMSDYLGNGACSVTQPYRRKFQVRSLRGSEAQEAAMNHKGSAVQELITHDRLPPDPVGCGFAHVSEEAKEIAELNRNGMISGLLGGKTVSNIPLVGVEAPSHKRVQYEAIEYANRGQGEEMKNIITQKAY